VRMHDGHLWPKGREAQRGIVFIAALGWCVYMLFRGDGLGVACVYNRIWRSEIVFIAAQVIEYMLKLVTAL